MKEGKMRKFADKQARIKQTDGSKTETTLSSVDTRGSWPIIRVQTISVGVGDYTLTSTNVLLGS